jgi:anti-sigma factor RsiW
VSTAKNHPGRSRHEALQLLFDRELDDGEAATVAAEIDNDEEMKRHLAQLGVLRQLVAKSLEQEAAALPAARFAQVWDRIDREIDRDQAGATEPTPLWTRLRAAFGRLRTPVLVAAGAAAVTALVLRMMAPDETNKVDDIASVPEPVTPEPAPQPMPTPPSTKIAKTEPESFPAPKAGDAEIHGIEFGGKQGRISQTGTLTVVYVEEDEEPKPSERSL